jgi:hypothetical protein
MVFVMVLSALDFGDLDDVWRMRSSGVFGVHPRRMKINVAQKPLINTAVAVTTYIFNPSARSSRDSITCSAVVYSC